MDGPGFRKSKLDGDELFDWFDDGLEELVAELARRGPDDPCPNFNPGSPKVVRFWLRRQLNETSLHRWDIESATDAPTSFEVDVAADGIDEYLDVFVRTRGKQTLTGPLRVSATDADRTWILTPSTKPGRVDVATDPAIGTVAELRGAASDLLLHVWRRRTLGDSGLAITGDSDVARSLTEAV